jgi:hypothetical protein
LSYLCPCCSFFLAKQTYNIGVKPYGSSPIFTEILTGQ